jgi:hypothetical protein
MQSLPAGHICSDGIVESLSLDRGELQLLLADLTGAVSGSKVAGTKGSTATGLAEVGHEREGLGVAQWHEDDAVVREGAQRRDGRALLAATEAGAADHDTGHLAIEAARAPLLARLVPEDLPLRGEVAVSRWDTEKEAIVLLELGGVIDRFHVRILGWSVHLLEYLSRQCLGDPGDGASVIDCAVVRKSLLREVLLEQVGSAASLLDAL